MKKLTLVPLTALLFAISPVSQASDSENMSLRICEYVQANDKTRLRKFLKNQKLKIRNLYSDLRCNNDNILIFSAKSQALDVGDFIIGKLPTKDVAEQLEAITALSPHLAASAQKRIK